MRRPARRSISGSGTVQFCLIILLAGAANAGSKPAGCRSFLHILQPPVDVSADPAEIGPGMAEARSAAYPQTLSGDDLPTPLGLKISMGSAIALAVALLAGYLWAFQITSPPDRASLTESPEMRALQVKYDMEKKRIEDIQISLKTQNAEPRLPSVNGIKQLRTARPGEADSTGMQDKCADQADSIRQAQKPGATSKN